MGFYGIVINLQIGGCPGFCDTWIVALSSHATGNVLPSSSRTVRSESETIGHSLRKMFVVKLTVFM
jgi:hypothetical protein